MSFPPNDTPPKDKSLQYTVFWAMMGLLFFLTYCARSVTP